MGIEWAGLIPWVPALGAVLCGMCCMNRSLRRAAAGIAIASIFGAFVISLLAVAGTIKPGQPSEILPVFEWIHAGGFRADFSYFIDPLTAVMLLVVTGVGTLVAIYAAGYMSGDRGYARFFAAVCLFLFAMTTLVMADNLVLLYLGWEGVGLCSYLLIGFYYQKPAAVEAAKKAFIVNRIGDLGFALGIMLTYVEFGSVQYADLFNDLAVQRDVGLSTQVIPFLLMLGAFGKSAQIPLYMWLPDAMEGPTPVSALIHAATMVTAGVYMIVRLIPLFELSPYALPLVAMVGTGTALFAATIALCQYDIKRVFAYSTISQLGYMFLGVGVLSTVGGVFHLFTHAFFKALLFLTAGSVMHGLAGQLDMRKMSGLRTKMPVTCWLMFVGCLALSGFPFLSGFYSKDMILADVMTRGLASGETIYTLMAGLGLLTAFLTAYYTFRLWFRVFMGPTQYEMGDEHSHGGEHGAEKQHSDPETTGGSIQVEHHYDAHEVSWLMNGPLVVLAVGSVLAGWLCEHWIHDMVMGSSAVPTRAAADPGGHHPVHFLGMDVHSAMALISSVVAISGIGLAAYFHWFNRPAADRLASRYSGLVRLLANKYYVDELLDAVVVRPLRLAGDLCFVFDRLVIDGLVWAVAWVPRALGLAVRPAQHGVLQGYGIGMAVGTVVLVWLVAVASR